MTQLTVADIFADGVRCSTLVALAGRLWDNGIVFEEEGHVVVKGVHCGIILWLSNFLQSLFYQNGSMRQTFSANRKRIIAGLLASILLLARLIPC